MMGLYSSCLGDSPPRSAKRTLDPACTGVGTAGPMGGVFCALKCCGL